MARIEEKVDTLLASNMDKEQRIRKVEKWMYGLPVSAAIAIAGLITAVMRHHQ